jgi:hypothetical protein
MRRLVRIVPILLIVGVAAGVGFGIWMVGHMSAVIRNSYAVWWVADMVVEHMKANGDEWPNGWDDLHDDYQTCVNRAGQPWTFEELSNRVRVDWSANPMELRKALRESAKPRFRVIWLSDGMETHWQGAEPNQIIADYLDPAQANRRNQSQ